MTKYRIVERNDGNFTIQNTKYDHYNEPYWDNVYGSVYPTEHDARMALESINKRLFPNVVKHVVEEFEMP